MNRLTKIGLIGAVITAICCFTPLLVWLLAAIGLAAAIGYIDVFLIPILGAFITLALFGYLRQNFGR